MSVCVGPSLRVLLKRVTIVVALIESVWLRCREGLSELLEGRSHNLVYKWELDLVVLNT